MLINEFKTQNTTEASLSGKLCIITGSNSGIGYEAALCMARAGGHIVMVCRNREKAEKARAEILKVATAPVDLVLADLSVMKEVEQLAATLLSRYPKIDILVNNAGLHSTTRTLTVDGIETVFAVNHLAPFLLTELLLARMKRSAPARIIHVNSQGHRWNGLDLNDLNWEQRRYSGLKSYGASKTANLFYTYVLAERLEGSNVTVNAMHPGSVDTNIGSNNGPLAQWIQRGIRLFFRHPSISGAAIYYLAAAPELAQTSGRFFNLTIDELPHFHTRWPKCRTLAQHTCLLSEQLTGLTVSRLEVDSSTVTCSSNMRSHQTKTETRFESMI